MSAWICSDKHIASLVITAFPESEQQEVADELKEQNIRSVNYRYDEDTEITPCDLSKGNVLAPIDVVSLAHSLDYQSCEHPEWEDTKAYRYIRDMVYDFADYDGGKWSI